jgi:hydroxycarboxylate dehydrogenase B
MMDITLSAAQWHEIAIRLFRSWGASPDAATCVADSLVGSDLAGVYSHGVLRIPHYHSFTGKGWLKPGNAPKVAKDEGATLTVDGQWGFGQPAAHLGLKLAMDKARQYGVAAAGIIHAGHIGRLGEYAEKAAAENMMCIICASGGATGGLMAPFGGAERVFSTNPIAAGAPAGEHPPFIMDFATSIVAAGKIELMPNQDAAIPEGWAIDKDGNPARTPRAMMEGGAILPFGSHKGYAVALLVELLAGALTGAGVTHRPAEVPTQGLGGNATFLLVIDVAHFVAPADFEAEVEGLFSRLKTVKPAKGFKSVMVPGEPEAEARLAKARDGINLDTKVWDQIAAIAAEHNVKLDDIVGIR